MKQVYPQATSEGRDDRRNVDRDRTNASVYNSVFPIVMSSRCKTVLLTAQTEG
jgi:hypothetical protein